MKTDRAEILRALGQAPPTTVVLQTVRKPTLGERIAEGAVVAVATPIVWVFAVMANWPRRRRRNR